MTHLPTPQPATTTPCTIRLGELAMAAGMAGMPVALCYQEFPAPILSEVWRHYIRTAGPDSIHHVRTQGDLNRLPERLGDLRLVLVHTPRLHVPTAWSIRLAEPVDGEDSSRPAMLSRFVPDDLDEDPGATLVVRATARENAAIAHWLAARHDGGNNPLPDCGPVPVGIPAWLSPVLSAEGFGRVAGRLQFRDLEILRALLAGACVLRVCGGGETADPAEVNREDYEGVRQLLRIPILRPVDVVSDPLATVMVARANVYLAAKSGEVRRSDKVSFGPDDGHDRPGGLGKDPITRREIADLGNVRSGMVRRLVDYLHQGADGYQWYCRMGLAHRAPSSDAWSASTLDSLTVNLRPWSLKQVRTHFDRLRRTGLITAEREHGNGPWRYELPEELTDVACPFGALPPGEELNGHESEAVEDAEP